MTVSLIEYSITLASLRVAEEALREEPYARLPALAGTLAIAAMQFEQLRDEAMGLRAAIEHVLEHDADQIGRQSAGILRSALEREQVLE